MTDDLRHGLPSTYTGHGCRCDDCRKAWNAYQKTLSSKRGTAKIVEHGILYSYRRGCRCDECKAVAARDRRQRRHAADKNKANGVARTGLCDCCGKEKDTVLDHDHKTGEFRGYLCHSCNTGIGKLGDNIEGLERALDYLRRTTK